MSTWQAFLETWQEALQEQQIAQQVDLTQESGWSGCQVMDGWCVCSGWTFLGIRLYVLRKGNAYDLAFLDVSTINPTRNRDNSGFLGGCCWLFVGCRFGILGMIWLICFWQKEVPCWVPELWLPNNQLIAKYFCWNVEQTSFCWKVITKSPQNIEDMRTFTPVQLYKSTKLNETYRGFLQSQYQSMKSRVFHKDKTTQNNKRRGKLLLMEESLLQLIGSFSHYLQGFSHPRWCIFFHQQY